MKQCLMVILAMAVSLSYGVEPDEVVIRDTHGVVASGSWVNMRLESSCEGKSVECPYLAKTIDPVYNHEFTELLIPANSLVSGLYHNDGKSCYFSVDKISFKNTEITLKSGAYSTVIAAGGRLACNPDDNYLAGQVLEFKMLQDIKDLDEVAVPTNKAVSNDLVVAIANPDYTINDISDYGSLLQVRVKFNNPELAGKLIPIFYDDNGIGHHINYKVSSIGANESAYLMLGTHDNFGFGVEDVSK